MTHKSHIEKLIQEMCPNGVNYMPLGEVCRSIFAGGTPSTKHEEYYAGSRSKCRNPLLQTMFRLVGYGEKAGSGADIIAQGWAENHWARPTISESFIPGETELVLNLRKDNEAGNVTGNVAGNVTGNVAGNVTGNVKRLVLVIEDSTKTREEIMALLNLKGSGNFRANYLYPALNEGFIAKLYPDAESRTDQAYYLTEKGLRLYKELM